MSENSNRTNLSDLQCGTDNTPPCISSKEESSREQNPIKPNSRNRVNGASRTSHVDTVVQTHCEPPTKIFCGKNEGAVFPTSTTDLTLPSRNNQKASLRISWKKPLSMICTIDSYGIRMNLVPDHPGLLVPSNETVKAIALEEFYIATDLLGDRVYEFSIKSFDRNGYDGPYSPAIRCRTPTDIPPPSNVMARQVQLDRILVTWDSVRPKEMMTSSYIVVYRQSEQSLSDGHELRKVVNDGSTSLEISDVEVNTLYLVSVGAIIGSATGVLSPPVKVFISPGFSQDSENGTIIEVKSYKEGIIIGSFIAIIAMIICCICSKLKLCSRCHVMSHSCCCTSSHASHDMQPNSQVNKASTCLDSMTCCRDTKQSHLPGDTAVCCKSTPLPKASNRYDVTDHEERCIDEENTEFLQPSLNRDAKYANEDASGEEIEMRETLLVRRGDVVASDDRDDANANEGQHTKEADAADCNSKHPSDAKAATSLDPLNHNRGDDPDMKEAGPDVNNSTNRTSNVSDHSVVPENISNQSANSRASSVSSSPSPAPADTSYLVMDNGCDFLEPTTADVNGHCNDSIYPVHSTPIRDSKMDLGLSGEVYCGSHNTKPNDVDSGVSDSLVLFSYHPAFTSSVSSNNPNQQQPLMYNNPTLPQTDHLKSSDILEDSGVHTISDEQLMNPAIISTRPPPHEVRNDPTLNMLNLHNKDDVSSRNDENGNVILYPGPPQRNHPVFNTRQHSQNGNFGDKLAV